METIQDLFEPSNKVKIREDPEKGVFLDGVQWIKVESTDECAEAFISGEKNRVTASTTMNAHSSRSHTLLIVKIEKSLSKKNINNDNIDAKKYTMTKSFLYLVDLAGSERVNKTNARNERLEEAKKINSSLLILGNCIQSLIAPNNIHVSYRDCKLTRILQESIGGNAKTSLIVTVSPSNYNCEETLSSLNFGARAMKVKNKPIINQTEDYQAQLIKLQEEYDKLMDDYSKLKIEYDKVCDENYKLKNGEILIELQKQSIKNDIENRISLAQSIGKNNNNDNINNVNKYFLNNDIKGNNDNNNVNNIYEKNKYEMNQKMFDLEESNNELNEKLKNLEIYYENMKKELEFEIENKELIINKLNNDKELLNITIETMKREIKEIEEEKNDLLKEKSAIFISLTDIINYNEELKIQVENLKDKYESIKKENEEKPQKTIKKNQNTQTLSLFDDSLKKRLEKIGINHMSIIKNDVNSVIKFILNQINENVIDKNALFKYEQENIDLKNNYEKNVNELKKLNKIINTVNNDKKRLENLLSEKENKINELKKELNEKENNLNSKFEELKNEYEIKLQNSKNELNDLSNEYHNFSNNINNKLLYLRNEYENALKIQKEMILLNKLFESYFKNSKNDDNLKKIKEHIVKIGTLINNNDIYYLSNNEKINNETLDSIKLKIKDIFKFIFESYINISKQLYSQFKKINELQKNNIDNEKLKRKFVLQLKGFLDKYSKIIEINSIKNQYNNQINKYNEINLDECICFILSIFDNLVMKILNEENSNFNKYDKLKNNYYKNNNISNYQNLDNNNNKNYNEMKNYNSNEVINIEQKIKQNGKELKELEAELKKINDLEKKNKK